MDQAAGTFGRIENLTFETIPEDRLPFADQSFEAVTALNIIEHFDDPYGKLKQIHRVLKPGGCLILTTVNRELRLFPWQKPWNDLHRVEFSPRSLQRALLREFSNVEFWGMHFVGPFFPDLASTACRRKFSIAIEYPIRNALRKTVRPILAKVFPVRFATHPHTTESVESGDKLIAIPSDSISFEDACKDAEIRKNEVVILAVATRGKE